MWSFEGIYSAEVERLFRYVLRLVGSRETAEDITSETFMALYRHREGVTDDRLPGWLYTTAKNRARDYWRRVLTERRLAEQVRVNELTSAAEPAFLADLIESKALKPVHRLCLILRYVHGMTRAEIAAYTSLSEMQIKGHLQYALQLLRKEIADRGVARGD